MNSFDNSAKRKIMATIKDRFFWSIQFLNVEYFFKYYAKFSFLTTVLSIVLSFLKIEIDKIHDGKTALFVTSLAVSLLIVKSMFDMIRDMFKVMYDWLFNDEFKKETITKVLKSFLFYGLIVNSNYLKTDYFKTIHTEVNISENMLLSSLSFLATYLIMRFCIKQFWERSVLENIQVHPTTQQEFPFRLTETYLNERLKYSGTIEDFVTPLAIRTEYSRLSVRPVMIDKDQKKHPMDRPVVKQNSVLFNLKYSLVAPKWVSISEVMTETLGTLSNAKPKN